MAFGADVFLQELLDPFHALFILYFGKGVLDGVDSVVVCEIQFSCLVCALRLVENVLFLGGAVVDYLLLLVAEVLEGYVGPDAHLTADVRHEGPHQGIPGGDGAFVDGEVFIGNEGR